MQAHLPPLHTWVCHCKHMDLSNLLERVIHTTLSAGELLIEEWTRPNGPRGSGDKAEVDVEIELQLREDLLSILPCDFWGEETGFALTGDQYCWVVDPNDGTSDFLRGAKGSAVSIGLLRNGEPVLGVVYAPVLHDRPSDCIGWAKGLPCVLRNGVPVLTKLSGQVLSSTSTVMMSLAAQSKPGFNAQLCAPAAFEPMPSIAYRLARVAAGDGIAAISLYPVSAHDVAAGHALLIGAGGVLLDENGNSIIYSTTDRMKTVSRRCFGGTLEACQTLVTREWSRVFV